MITRSIKMALKKIHEMCKETRGCDRCPFDKKGECFFTGASYGKMPEDWDFDMLKEE